MNCLSLLCGCTMIFFEKRHRNVWIVKIFRLPLHRYPENNLFTLKGLIPIED